LTPGVLCSWDAVWIQHSPAVIGRALFRERVRREEERQTVAQQTTVLLLRTGRESCLIWYALVQYKTDRALIPNHIYVYGLFKIQGVFPKVEIIDINIGVCYLKLFNLF
jgi:hypothetical protein